MREKLTRSLSLLESRFIEICFKNRKIFFNTIVIIHVGFFGLTYPDIVLSSIWFWLLMAVPAATFGYDNMVQIFDHLFTYGRDKEKTKRILIYGAFASISIHGFFFKPSESLLTSNVQNDK